MNKESTEMVEITTFLKILMIILIFFGAIFIITSKFIVNKTATTQPETSYNEIIGSAILKQNESEYYVLLYNSKGTLKDYYSELRDKYLSSTTTVKLYFVDLNNTLNSKFITTDKSTLNVTDITKLKVNDGTLLRIKDNKISDYKETYKEIKNTLEL